MTTSSFSPNVSRAQFEELAENIRPELHRYIARMIGSALDAEDVVQDTLVKAYDALPTLTSDTNVRGWLFRIAHNKAIDYLRREQRQVMEPLEEQALVVLPDFPLEERELATLALSVFLKLAPRQRSCVILKDVLDYSLIEISELLNASVPEIKAALHRGRTRLRELSGSLDGSTPSLNDPERALLARYVDRFNARDFDAVRAMLAEEVQLDLVGRVKHRGPAAVNDNYLHKYRQGTDWHLAIGTVEGHPAILVSDPQQASPQPLYFMLITWDNTQVSQIRDYYHARYVLRDAEVTLL